MSTYSGVISYSDTSGNDINRAFAYNQVIYGRDSFYEISSPERLTPWAGIIETGEEQVAPDGGKSNVMEVWLKTYTEGTTAPDCYMQFRGSADSAWWSSGDTDAIIAVTNSTCTGTGCAWSNLIAVGDDASTVFDIPCLVESAVVYVGATPVTLQTLDVDYTKTGAKQITLTTPLLSGTNLYVYWTGAPFIKMAVGDIIETSYGWHRVTAIPTYNTLTLASYPQPTISSVAGTHHKAKQLPVGEGETIFGVNRVLDTMQLRFVIVPRYAAAASTNVRPLSFKIGFVATGERQKKV